MYLKRLDIQGFKSFPEKVKLEFNKGVTAIVGPNGSGKSNISDAVRWVLGEQKAKSLRGDKMEDVIFTGTQNRKALGFAEVSITIDNQNNKLPIDYTEVTVTRRVFRSGESDYLINGVGCRLKDVHELFMDTGVGREGYSIIGQGKIDEILSSKSDDRRKLFEEAAGIVKYKNRRQEASVKLEKERQNLLRIDDIIGELESQIEPLADQAETAKKYLQIREQLKESEITLFVKKAEQIEAALQESVENHQIAADEMIAKQTAYEKEKEAITAIRQETERISQEIQRKNDELIASRTQVEQKEGGIRLVEQKGQTLTDAIARIQGEIETSRKQIDSNENEFHIQESKGLALAISMQGEQEKLASLEEAFGELNKALSENESQMEEYKSAMIEKMKQVTEEKGSLSRLQAMREQFQARQEQLKQENAYTKSQIHDNETHIAAVKKNIENATIEEITIQEQAEKLTIRKEELEMKLTSSVQDLQNLQRSMTEKQSRLRILSDMEREHEGFYKSVKAVLKQKEQGNPLFSGIHGAVGELLQVAREYETAIEIALGGSLQSIVTSSEEDAKKAIAYLKQSAIGRATFLPITAVKGKEFGSERYSLLQEKGVLGIAKELIQYDPVYEGIMASLLGRVVVVDNLDAGIALAKKYHYSHRIVTLEGDLINPGGAMTGGSTGRKAVSVFGRSREINELRAALLVLSQTMDQNTAAKKKLEDQLEDCGLSLEECAESAQELKIKKLTANQDLDQTAVLLREHYDKLKNIELEESQLAEQAQAADEDIEKYETRLNEVEKEITEINQKLSTYQDSMESEKSGREELLDEITKLRVNLSGYEQNKISIAENIKRLKQEISSIEQKIKAFEQEIASCNKQIEENEQEKETLLEILSGMRKELEEAQASLSDMIENRRQQTATASQKENTLQEAMETITVLKNNLYKIEMKQEKLAEEKQTLYQSVWEEYEITYQMAKRQTEGRIFDSHLEQSTKELKQNLKNLGSVNVDAIDQYKEVKDRFEFLANQRNDIIKAEESLKGIIAELTLMMEAQFQEQFELISQNFNVVFQEMFGGGMAYLKLSDKDNILESGIEIIAQPPGKKLQNMSLLSGGERALTAIAILFSILIMKPSPFCILDEIEAALDDANVKRFANYLGKFSGDTQFIVITHRKGTMEAADVLYGVTMQEQGVSKIVSVKFEEQAG